MLIDKSFFIGNINIPNTGNVAVGEKLDWYINKYESDFLLFVLGYDLNKAFKAGIAAAEPDQKWKDLRDGVEYAGLGGRNRKWRGLIETVAPAIDDAPVQQQSPIANYVYYFFLRSIATYTTGLGEVVAKAENGDVVSPVEKMCSTWNEMIDWINELVCFLDAKRTDYPEWDNQSRTELLYRFRKINSFGI